MPLPCVAAISEQMLLHSDWLIAANSVSSETTVPGFRSCSSTKTTQEYFAIHAL